MGKLGDLLNEFDTGGQAEPAQQPIQQQSSKLSGLLNAFDSGEPEVIAEPVQTTKFDEQGVVGSELAPPTQEQELEADVLLGTAEPESKLQGLMKDFETKETPVAPVKFKGFFNELGRAVSRGTLGVGAGIAGTAQSVEDFLNQGKFGGTGEDIADFLREKQKGFAPTVGGSKTKKFIANAVGEALPFMAGTLGATLIGGPVAGVSVAFSVEGDNAYQEAIESGASEEDANMDRMIVGSINAALEKLQIDKLLGGAANSGQIIKQIVTAAKKKAGKEVAKLGKKLTVETLKTAVTEGIQEGAQEFVSVTIPGLRSEEQDLGAIGKRVGQAALGGAVAGSILGGGGAIIQSLSETTPDADGFRTVELETPEAAQEAATAIADKAQADGFNVEVKTDNNKLSVKESGVPVLGDKPGEDSQADSFNQRIEEIGDIVSTEETVEQAPQVEAEAKVEVQPAIEGEETKAAQTEREAADVVSPAVEEDVVGDAKKAVRAGGGSQLKKSLLKSSIESFEAGKGSITDVKKRLDKFNAEKVAFEAEQQKTVNDRQDRLRRSYKTTKALEDRLKQVNKELDSSKDKKAVGFGVTGPMEQLSLERNDLEVILEDMKAEKETLLKAHAKVNAELRKGNLSSAKFDALVAKEKAIRKEGFAKFKITDIDEESKAFTELEEPTRSVKVIKGDIEKLQKRMFERSKNRGNSKGGALARDMENMNVVLENLEQELNDTIAFGKKPTPKPKKPVTKPKSAPKKAAKPKLRIKASGEVVAVKQPTKKERLAAKPKVAPKKFKPKAIPAGTPTSKSREKALEKFQKEDAPKQRGLSKSIEKATVEKGLTDFFENIPEFQSVDLKEQASESSALVNKNPEQAKRIAMGQEVAPKGVIPEMVLVAVSNKALQEGDVDTLRDIATSSRLTQEATTMGQRIRALGELDKASPIKAMVKVAKVREEVFTKKNKKRKIKAEKKSEVVKIKDSIKKAKVKNGAKALNDFISALEC